MQALPFEEKELLCRAVLPCARFFLKHNGRLSNAAFKDRRGLSVDRQAGRTEEECVRFMKDDRGLHGDVYAVTYHDCEAIEALVLPIPTPNDVFHCEIHGSQTQAELFDEQAMALTLVARCL